MLSQEIGLMYDPTTEKEWLPKPKFNGIYWQGMPNEQEVQGQVMSLDGVSWELLHVGFQGSDGKAEVIMHPEPTEQEDVFFLQGKGKMIIWNGLESSKGKPRLAELAGIFSQKDIEAATFILAVASWNIPYLDDLTVEHLVLNVEVDGLHESIEPVSTPRGFHHGYELSEASHYLIVKRKPLVSSSN